MGKKSKSKKGSFCQMEFHALYINTNAGASGDQVQLSPSGLSAIATRFLAEADAWGYFRFDWLKFRALPGTVVSAGYCPVQDTFPATALQIGELVDSCYIPNATQSVPTEWVNVRKPDLAGPFPWYKAVNGTFDATEEAPGYLVVKATAASTYNVELRFSVTFKEQVAAANTPAELDIIRARMMLRQKTAADAEKRKLFQALAPVPSIKGSVVTPPPAAAEQPVRLLVCGVCDARAGGAHRTDCPLRGVP